MKESKGENKRESGWIRKVECERVWVNEKKLRMCWETKVQSKMEDRRKEWERVGEG